MANAVDTTISFATLDEARSHLLLPEEQSEGLGRLADIVNAVARAMETYCGRRLKRRVATDIYDGEGGKTLFLRDFPIAQSPSPTIWADDTGNGEFTTAAQLTIWPGSGSQLAYQVAIDWSTGEMRRIDTGWPRGFQNVKVTATVGIDPLAAEDLKQAQLLWVAQYWGLVGRDPAMSSRSVLGMSMSYEAGSGDESYAIQPQIRALLDPHRLPAIAT